jgi:hypothetical protein
LVRLEFILVSSNVDAEDIFGRSWDAVVVRIGVSGSATISTRHNTPWALAGDIDNRRPGSGVGRNGLVS